jgi:glycosyltransferase involved in cell wall biosynthesis
MRILFVHADKVPWATTQRAKYLKRELKNHEVDICYYKNLPNGEQYDIIQILFSGGIGKIKDFILKYKDKTFTTLASQRTLDYFFDKEEDLIEIYSNTVCCICQNTELEHKLRLLINQGNMTYIPNGVDTKLFNRKFVVGFVGVPSEHKGINLIEEACKELELVFAQAINVSHEDMPEFYRGIDCLVIPSQSEGCNNPTLEALAMNIPVISTGVGIAGELEGVNIVERDVESIKKALRKLSGRIQILEEFTWDKIAKDYKNVWDYYSSRKRK